MAKLDTFFTQLNATRFEPFDWAGNEPGEWIPFEYDYAGAPWRTQSVVRSDHEPASIRSPPSANRARTTSGPCLRGTCGPRWVSIPKPRGWPIW